MNIIDTRRTIELSMNFVTEERKKHYAKCCQVTFETLDTLFGLSGYAEIEYGKDQWEKYCDPFIHLSIHHLGAL
jgi:hypothetical protein